MVQLRKGRKSSLLLRFSSSKRALTSTNNALLSTKQNASFLNQQLLTPTTYNVSTVQTTDPLSSSSPKKARKDESKSCEGLFIGKVFLVEFGNSVHYKRKSDFLKLITDNGGTVSHVLTNKVDAVIIGEQGDTTGYRVKKAVSLSIPVVNLYFIHTCLEENKLLPLSKFSCTADLSKSQLQAGVISDNSQKKTSRPRNHRTTVDLNKYPAAALSDSGVEKILFGSEYSVLKYRLLRTKDQIATVELIYFKVKSEDLDSLYSVYLYEQKQSGVNNEIRAVNTALEAERLMDTLYKMLLVNYKPIEDSDLTNPDIGSRELRRILNQLMGAHQVRTPEMRRLVNSVWDFTMSTVNEYQPNLSCLSPASLLSAQALLENLRRKEHLKDENLKEITNKIKSLLKLRECEINNHNDINKMLDVVQLLRDVYIMSEATGWSQYISLSAKISALRLSMSEIYRDSVVWDEHSGVLMTSGLTLHNMYAVNRDDDFLHNLTESSSQYLYHGTKPEYMLGILSRGLLMPTVLDKYSVIRSDYGKLGAGIYFSDSASHSHTYTKPLPLLNGRRLMLVCLVDLGDIYETEKELPDLLQPPHGYHSVKSLKYSMRGEETAFSETEFVIYNIKQQKIKYILEYSDPDDDVSDESFSDSESYSSGLYEDECTIMMEEATPNLISDLPSEREPAECACLSVGGTKLPLKSIHITARLIDLAAEVTIFQEYYSSVPGNVEAKFAFPLPVGSAVCGFEAFIGSKHVIGEVKEKEKAHKEYKEAVTRGDGAYLMDQHEERDDVFMVSVGNLPMNTKVIIKIMYVCELKAELGDLVFSIPSNIASWIKRGLTSEETQDQTSTQNNQDSGSISCSLKLSLDMPHEITSLNCSTHLVKTKKTDTMAVVELCKNQTLNNGFKLSLKLNHIHAPRLIIENIDDASTTQARMLSFHPEFETHAVTDYELTILIDVSRSMSELKTAQTVANRVLHMLPEHSYINIAQFASGHKELFIQPILARKDAITQSQEFIQRLKVKPEHTNLMKVMQNYRHLIEPEDGIIHNVLLISDGHIGDGSYSCDVVKQFPVNLRLFTLAISSGADVHMMQRLASLGNGHCHHLDESTSHTWNEKISSIVSKFGEQYLSHVRICWNTTDQTLNSSSDVLQTPTHLPAIYSGDRLVVYSLMKSQVVFEMAELRARLSDDLVEIVVNSSPLNSKQGNTIHRLAIRSHIRDWSDGIFHNDPLINQMIREEKKDSIIQYSTNYQIVCQFTSFVAIEERDSTKRLQTEPDLKKLASDSFYDPLSYISYQNEQSSPIYSPTSPVYSPPPELPPRIRYTPPELPPHLRYTPPEFPQRLQTLPQPKRTEMINYKCLEMNEEGWWAEEDIYDDAEISDLSMCLSAAYCSSSDSEDPECMVDGFALSEDCQSPPIELPPLPRRQKSLHSLSRLKKKTNENKKADEQLFMNRCSEMCSDEIYETPDELSSSAADSSQINSKIKVELKKPSQQPQIMMKTAGSEQCRARLERLERLLDQSKAGKTVGTFSHRNQGFSFSAASPTPCSDVPFRVAYSEYSHSFLPSTLSLQRSAPIPPPPSGRAPPPSGALQYQSPPGDASFGGVPAGSVSFGGPPPGGVSFGGASSENLMLGIECFCSPVPVPPPPPPPRRTSRLGGRLAAAAPQPPKPKQPAQFQSTRSRPGSSGPPVPSHQPDAMLERCKMRSARSKNVVLQQQQQQQGNLLELREKLKKRRKSSTEVSDRLDTLMLSDLDQRSTKLSDLDQRSDQLHAQASLFEITRSKTPSGYSEQLDEAVLMGVGVELAVLVPSHEEESKPKYPYYEIIKENAQTNERWEDFIRKLDSPDAQKIFERCARRAVSAGIHPVSKTMLMLLKLITTYGEMLSHFLNQFPNSSLEQKLKLFLLKNNSILDADPSLLNEIDDVLNSTVNCGYQRYLPAGLNLARDWPSLLLIVMIEAKTACPDLFKD